MYATPFAAADVTAAVLAGGQGTRVGGEDKGLLPLAGRPLVAHVCERLRGQSGTLLICANRHADRYAQYGVVVADSATGYRGPLAGIAAALAACATPWLLTVPVDAPDLPTDLAPRLWHAAHSAGARAVAVAQNGQREPVFALYRRELADSARTTLAGDAAVWRWQNQCGAIEVDMSDEAGAFVNLNTAEDFRRREAGRHG